MNEVMIEMSDTVGNIGLSLILWTLLYPIVGVIVAFVGFIYSWIKDPMHRIPRYMSSSELIHMIIWIYSITTLGAIILSIIIPFH